ncbi:U32 family peptidase [Chitiniphilus shinanonensis]|uniref:Ubiquinone biosynthesis protein UbiV n=1 Tax=Chitiniphilus shinanonensis TaxID=553088 RepID=A0ABQ6BUN8_9NEIS|nr:U32 family peptidase [Chitiniphilus shinanonensis]GLS05715.1 U32 family peptidase [Chitiniphilus shinanonensis]
MKLTLGPMLYYWPRSQLLAFYEAALEWPVDIVYLGETVCARRHELRTADWLALAERFRDAGKTPVLSSQALLESASDSNLLGRLAASGYLVEANDLGAVKVARDAGVGFVAGPHLNIYNGPMLDWMAAAGAVCWLPPLELGHDAIAAVLAEKTCRIQTEVFAHGRLPLAFSARCFTARHYGLNKDECEFKCMEHPDGLLMETQEGKPFLRLNGIQTQSAACHTLWHHLDEVRELGVDSLRISPQSQYTPEIVAAFAARLAGNEAQADWATWNREGLVDGYWRGTAGIADPQGAEA